MTKRFYKVEQDFDGMRIDSMCAHAALYESRSAAARAIDEGKVLVDGAPVKKNDCVRSGASVVYELPDKYDFAPIGENIPLDIRYEDQELLVICKQAGLVCHPCDEYLSGTLVNALIAHCGIEHLCNVQGEDNCRLGIVHRLDKDTSGLMLAAKTDAAGQALMDDIRNKHVERHYLVLVHGIIPVDSGMVDAPLDRHPKQRMRRSVIDSVQARAAITTFRTLERFRAFEKNNGYTLLDCKLFTGRTHQIRVHMEYIKHPVVGDELYTAHAPRAQGANRGLERQFLHSYFLQFAHPLSGEEMQFYASLPDDLKNVLADLAPYSTGRTEVGNEIIKRLEED